jgi:DNA helicase HerA-like ATPase
MALKESSSPGDLKIPPEGQHASGISTTTDAPVDIVLGTAASGSDEVSWRVSIRANPHLMLVGLPGMGKTTCLINICRQLAGAGVAPIVFSYHDDIDEKLHDALGTLKFIDYDGLGFNPLRVDAAQSTAFVDVAGTLRDIFASIFPDLGDLQLEELRQAIKQSYTDLGWGSRSMDHPVPQFRAFFDILTAKPKPNLGLLARLQELSDYGFFEGIGNRASLLDEGRPSVVRIHGTTNSVLQNAFSSFVLYSLYKDMFRRGVQPRLTHAVIFDEAHRAARLKLIPQFGKECRKFGLALALASQEARDFDPSLFAAVGSYLVLRVTEADARTLARMTGSTLEERRTADRLKALDRYTALFFGEGRPRPISVHLAN